MTVAKRNGLFVYKTAGASHPPYNVTKTTVCRTKSLIEAEGRGNSPQKSISRACCSNLQLAKRNRLKNAIKIKKESVINGFLHFYFYTDSRGRLSLRFSIRFTVSLAFLFCGELTVPLSKLRLGLTLPLPPSQSPQCLRLQQGYPCSRILPLPCRCLRRCSS